MSVAAGQQRVFLRIVAELRPHWRRDPALPARLQALLARRREFGARDRRLYRELVYTTLRHLPWIEPWLDRDPAEAVRRVAWLAADAPATRGFREAFATGEPPAGDRAELLPAWFREHCPELFAPREIEFQLARAPLWLRLQTDAPERVAAEFDQRQWAFRPSEVLPTAWRILPEVDVTKSDAFQQGRIEVQDLGSQLLLETIGVEPGTRWLDACAGAGGKTLQLARLLGPEGRVAAHDIRPAALAELRARADRAGLGNIDVTPAPGAEFDGVLVDAPCSGSGTWRRAPHLKWIITPEAIARAAQAQRALLAALAARVRPGGRLVYATCSLSSVENERVVGDFLGAHRGFTAEAFARTFDAAPRGAGLLLLPSRHDTDGFFVASLRRR